MPKLPYGDRARVDLRKLTDYVLDPTHRTGRHKARVFAAVFGLTSDDAVFLHDQLSQAARSEDAELNRKDAYGTHYSIEFTMNFKGRSGKVRSLWTIRDGEEYPRFVTASSPRRTRAMAERSPKLLDVVALLRDIPEARLRRGQVGTVVDETDESTVLVEFADAEGVTVALPSIGRADLLVLDYGSIAAE